MAPLPTNGTKRWFLDYTVAAQQHTVMMRSSDIVDEATASAAFELLFSSLDSQLFTTVIDGMRVSDAGTNFSLPATYSGDTTFGSGTPTNDRTAQYVDFVGRSVGGRRVRVAVFGFATPTTNGDFRATPGEIPAIGSALTAISGSSDLWIAIDGNPVVWQNYANTGYNAYWQRAIR